MSYTISVHDVQKNYRTFYFNSNPSSSLTSTVGIFINGIYF